MDLINFPAGLDEEFRLQICRTLDSKDKEIKELNKEIIVLENKLERFNGSLNWKESENLKTQMAINNAIISAVYKELARFNLRPEQYQDSKSPNVLDVKLIKISLTERFRTWLKSVFNFKIVRNNN